MLLSVLQAYREVPLTLVLGLTTSADALQGLLPSDVTDICLAVQHFKLVSRPGRQPGRPGRQAGRQARRATHQSSPA